MGQTQTPAQALWVAKSRRNGMLSSLDWMRTRHQDETALGLTTTLTGAQYTQLLQYIQALRACMDPSVPAASVVWPAKPSFVS
jgi:hypothetical protein